MICEDGYTSAQVLASNAGDTGVILTVMLPT